MLKHAITFYTLQCPEYENAITKQLNRSASKRNLVKFNYKSVDRTMFKLVLNFEEIYSQFLFNDDDKEALGRVDYTSIFAIVVGRISSFHNSLRLIEPVLRI